MPNPKRRPNPIARSLWIAAGLVACGLGFLGILLPGMPATVFFIAAAACFTRGSDRLLQWVLNLPQVGPLVRNYRQGLGMPRNAKIWATITMALCVTLSIAKFPHAWQGALVAFFASCGALYIWLRIPTHRAESPPAPDQPVPPPSPRLQPKLAPREDR